MDLRKVDPVENRRRMENGEYYFAFAPDMVAARQRCRKAQDAYNQAGNGGDVSRRGLVELFRNLIQDQRPMPPQAPTPEEDEDLFADHPWCDGPVKMDYGYNVRLGDNVYINSNSVWIDTLPIVVGARTLIAPNCSFYSGTHPTCGRVRNGTNGPEMGAPITIGEDCWIGGGSIILPGVTIGRGTTIGAGSVVTKSIPEGVVAAGNPARVLKSVPKIPLELLPPGFNPYAEDEEVDGGGETAVS